MTFQTLKKQNKNPSHTQLEFILWFADRTKENALWTRSETNSERKGRTSRPPCPKCLLFLCMMSEVGCHGNGTLPSPNATQPGWKNNRFRCMVLCASIAIAWFYSCCWSLFLLPSLKKSATKANLLKESLRLSQLLGLFCPGFFLHKISHCFLS